MAGLSAQVSGSAMVEFLNRAGRLGGLTRKDVVRLNGDDELMIQFGTWFRERITGLIHGRFHPLEHKLEMVRGWPEVTEEMIQAALKEGRERIALFERESPNSLLLDIVVSVYRSTAHETLTYARNRMREAFGAEALKHDESFIGIQPHQVRWLDGITVPSPGVRIEVVDLGAHLNPVNCLVPAQVRGTDSAHAAVLYAAAQDPEWVRQMEGTRVPYVIAAGFVLDATVGANWSDSLMIMNHGNLVGLGAMNAYDKYSKTALPILREC